ncbi:MAG: acetaldehyde dehydrogenase (acetylating) [Pseudomonadota bacterium]|nr:acetaldehyde dehydrogenase (acetylating) [Pseudomonadota bacterium]
MAIKAKVAIVGSGNIGTDLMIKVMQTSNTLEMGAMVGIEPQSDGLAHAKEMGIAATHEGLEGLTRMPEWKDIELVLDATSAGAHKYNAALCEKDDKVIIDLTPAALGPYVVPVVNMNEHLEANNINMVSCGGQATIPIVHAVNRIAKVKYAEIVASISSKSAGPGTRANIDEFTKTTSKGLEVVGGAEQGKAIIVLNPAEPPLVMRDTVYTLSDNVDQIQISKSVEEMVKAVQSYVPGYRLKQEVQFERFGSNNKLHIPGRGDFEGIKSTIFLEVEGAGHYLPTYAGNLDIMTSAALHTAEQVIERRKNAG